jgi:uncharacterized membrane protein
VSASNGLTDSLSPERPRMHPILLLHIVSATIALVAGAFAMTVRKGSGLHAVSGSVFFVTMLCMSTSGAFLASVYRPNALNLLGASIAFYAVLTAWLAAKHREGTIGLPDRAALALGLLIGIGALVFAVIAATRPTGRLNGVPPFGYLPFGTIAFLFAAADFRMIRRGGLTGPKRVARHALRMAFAFLLATFSLYPGQAKLFSTALRSSSLVFLPHLLIVAITTYWLLRLSRSRRTTRVRAERAAAVTATHL